MLNTIQQILPFAGQLIIGIAAGVLLCAAGFCDAKENRSTLRVAGSSLIIAVLSFLASGTCVLQLCSLAGIDVPAVYSSTLLRCAAGGALCGAGYALCSCGPFSSIAAPGRGNLYTLWIAAGMILSLAVLKKLDNLYPGTFEFSIVRERVFSAAGSDIFTLENPALYVICGCAALIIFTKLISGNKHL